MAHTGVVWQVHVVGQAYQNIYNVVYGYKFYPREC